MAHKSLVKTITRSVLVNEYYMTDIIATRDLYYKSLGLCWAQN